MSFNIFFKALFCRRFRVLSERSISFPYSIENNFAVSDQVQCLIKCVSITNNSVLFRIAFASDKICI